MGTVLGCAVHYPSARRFRRLHPVNRTRPLVALLLACASGPAAAADIQVSSAGANIGAQPLLDAIVAYVPSPAERPARARDGAGGDDREIQASEAGPLAAYVWKTMADPFAGRITMFKVLSGSLRSDSTVQNPTRETAERLGSLVLLQGKGQTPVAEVKAGDLGAVAKLKETLTGDLLADKGVAFGIPPVKFPEPVISYAIEPKSRGDEEKISTSLNRLREEGDEIQACIKNYRGPNCPQCKKGRLHFAGIVSRAG